MGTHLQRYEDSVEGEQLSGDDVVEADEADLRKAAKFLGDMRLKPLSKRQKVGKNQTLSYYIKRADGRK